MKFLSQCYQLAKEIDKAVPVMQAAADLSDDGQIYAQLSQLLLNIDEFDSAIESAQLAIEKGSLRNQGTIHLVLGMAYYNKHEFAKALDELAKAESFKSSKKMAEQWQNFVRGEKRSFEQNETILASN